MESTKCFEVRTPDGSLLCRVFLTECELPAAIPKAAGSEAPVQKPTDGKESTRDEPMTAPQKRMLFRLMAKQGKEGEAAHEELKKKFRVRSLQEVSKGEASRMIEQMLETRGGNGHGSPV